MPKEQLLEEYNSTGVLSSRMTLEAALTWYPFRRMETFAHEWFRAGENHHGRRPSGFLRDWESYQATVPEGDKPSAEGLLAFFLARWEHHPWKPVWDDTCQLTKLCHQFRDTVWDVWLHTYYKKAKGAGHLATLQDKFDMLMLGSAGRVMVSFSHTDSEYPYLSFVAAEDEKKNMGVQGVGGTLAQVTELVEPFLHQSEEVRSLIHPYKSVSFA